ncbi:hypothetical protein [Sphingomonas sp.]|uniref:hypothetical protein n=1 Tax=Sphingomonas sp. TaxID=28214 RepID=UPI001B057FBB|nr:hypothetical protein [Sphingomonas sp.]MBO9714078.1 hypothetical protein [Sphingomonas sp.]
MRRLLVLTPLVLAAADVPDPLAFGPDPVTARVQGAEMRLHVLPGAPSMPVINPDAAERAGLKAGPFATRALIGPVRVAGRSAVVRIDLGQGEFKRRATWFEGRMTSDADGTIGPGGIPAPVVRFALRPAAPGERSLSFALADWGYLGMGVEVPAGEDTIRLRFSTTRAQSLATASAAAAIAAVADGRFDGEPRRMPVNLGVERPVRHLALGRAFAAGPVSLTGMMVRTSDFGSTASIGVQGEEPDPDEIVVTGEKQKGKRRMVVEVGADALAGCSSITFDKPAKRVVFSCR